MKKVSMTLLQGTVINTPAGKHDVIKDGNTYYLPFLTVEGSMDSDGDDEPEPEPKAERVAATPLEKVAPPVIEKATKKVAPTPKTAAKVEEDAPDFAAMSSDELMEFAQDNALDLAAYKKAHGITRLKGSTLIKAVKELYASADVSDGSDEDEQAGEVEEESPKAKGGAVTAEKILTILQKYEDEKLDEAGLKKALMSFADEKIATEFTKEFLMNANLTLEEAADLFIEYITPKAKSKIKDVPEPKGKRGGKKEPKYEDVDLNDLEVGDKVSVFWYEEEYRDTYTGHVSAVKKGKKGADNTVTIIYDEDGESVVFDVEVHTDIKRLV